MLAPSFSFGRGCRFKANLPTDVKLCVAGVHKANVAVTPSGCAFSALDEQSPCVADACTDPNSEECMLVTMAYCQPPRPAMAVQRAGLKREERRAKRVEERRRGVVHFKERSEFSCL